MISLLIAGGVYVAANSQGTTTEWPDFNNHTLRGEAIPSSQVVCRNTWGTPMLPDGKGGYSLIAPINQEWITESLIIPPKVTGGMVAYRPLPPALETTIILPEAAPPSAPAVPPTPVPPAPVQGMEATPGFETAPAPAAGTEAAAPGVEPEAAAPAAPADPFSPATPATPATP